MGSDRGRERYGVVARKVAAAVDAMATLVADLDSDLVGGRDSLELVAEWSRLEHLASAALMGSARRVAQTELWKRGGHRSPAHWLSHVTGVSVAEAVTLLETAEVVESAPDTREALSQGKVSVRQAKAIGRAENADPHAGKQLLASAPGSSTRETEKAANRIVAAASSESPEERADRHRRSRRLRRGVGDDGMGWGSWSMPPARQARYDAAIDAEQRAIFEERRAAGEHEPVEAYALDALCRILDRGLARREVAVGSDGVSIDEDWSFAKVIVKIDLAALDRGSVEPGEVCEVAGQGPIPVADVWRMIDGNAFIAAVSTRGTEISQVVHLGRKPTELQRTALEFLSDGVCQIDGCHSKARLEIDHVADWATTQRTELGELARVCGHHHDLKSHHGHRFGHLQPNGKRRLIPPDQARAPDTTRPPELTLHEGSPPGAPPDAPPGVEPSQGDLFDTG